MTTVGLFLCVLAFVGPGLVLRETSVLRISQRELNGLTPTARAELKRRQRVSHVLGVAAPWFGLAVFAGGIGLVGSAIPRLRRQEQSEERRTNAEVSKLEADLQPQTESDRRSALAKDVDEVTTIAGLELRTEPLVVETGPPFVVRMREARAVEDEVIDRLRELRPPSYELRSEVKFSSPLDRPLLLDALLYSELDQLDDIVVEIKFSDSSSWRNNLGNRVDEALALRARYIARARRSAIVWLVIVVGDDVSISGKEHDLLKRVQTDADGVIVTLIRRSDISTLQLPVGP
jgi:hypothetical protein